MKPTTELPRETGAYWWRQGKDYSWKAFGKLLDVTVGNPNSPELIAWHGEQCMGSVKNLGGQWAGPIPEPEEE